MPKQKTKKAIARRMKLTRTGKVLRRRMATGHLLSPKSPKRRRVLGKAAVVVGKIAANYRRLMGG
ncbi:MAG TPA: 50S ribosomal protein L35 [Planctomycetes bacterium]|nr:50S ribosomal protein L35 [Planctomycetota bacterium]